jgi:hypothetical protein
MQYFIIPTMNFYAYKCIFQLKIIPVLIFTYCVRTRRKECGRIRQVKSPALRHRIYKFKKKSILLWTISAIPYLILTCISGLIYNVCENNSYTVSMKNKCKIAIKHRVLNINGSSIHLKKKKKQKKKKKKTPETKQNMK